METPDLAALGDHGMIDAASLHELLAPALFGDPSIPHHQDLIGAFDGVQSVGDDQQGLAPHQLGYGGLNMALIICVHAGGGLVQNDDGGVLEDAAGDGNPLLLAPGETGPTLADDRVEALGKDMKKS
jgi:hypothetical protein